jgi:imidazolonepropionase-like amidohydrolase
LTPLPDAATSSALPAGADPAFALRVGLALLPGHGLVENVTVVVAGGTIADVQANVTDAAVPPAIADVLDLPGCTLLPGFIDSHAHLSFSGSPDPVAEIEGSSDVVLGLHALANAQTALASGVTTMADCGARGGVVIQLRDAITEGKVLGPRILASGAPITTTAGHCAWLGARADSLDDVIRQARRQVAAGADFLKVMMTGGNLTPGSKPNMLQYPAEVIVALVAEAGRLGRPLVAHAHSEQAVALAAAADVPIVAHGTCGSADRIGVSRTTLDALREAGTVMDPTITVGMHLPDQSAPPGEERSRIRRNMLPVFAAMHRHGIALLAGTDGGVTNVGHGKSAHAVLALHEEVGIGLEDALAAATERPAAALGLAGITGSIEAGLAADLLLLDADVREQPAALLRPARVWLSGRLSAAQGRLIVQPALAANSIR